MPVQREYPTRSLSMSIIRGANADVSLPMLGLVAKLSLATTIKAAASALTLADCAARVAPAVLHVFAPRACHVEILIPQIFNTALSPSGASGLKAV